MLDLLTGLRSLMTDTGAIMAAPSSAYRTFWIRDQLYCALALRHAGQHEEATRAFGIVLGVLRRYRHKIQHGPWEGYPHRYSGYLHCKYREDLEEVTDDWGHHQLDAIGLLFYTAAEMRYVLQEEDLSNLRFLVRYVETARYWCDPDIGMWEENCDPHASSIGAVVNGLRSLRSLVEVPEWLIEEGQQALGRLLPNESQYHTTDLALLSLVWPHRILLGDNAIAVIERVESELVRPHGTVRYIGDRYAGPDKWTAESVEPEWPMGFFWLSICRAITGGREQSREWLRRGLHEATEHSYLPEMYVAGAPNDNTPLAWAHAKGIIASTYQ